jgi:selenocysteine-specific elongation factor
MTELRVVATAGHVDHGKSSLILRLTGIDPDRWTEEKRRGMTIDLGYAWCTLPSGREIGFVDVPGHERFVPNMLAGVGPVPVVLFVVAANEGWRPQSEEHLAILDVLGVAGGVVALTKRDLVDDDELELVELDAREHLAGTVLDGATTVPVSSTTGEGVDRLTAALDDVLASTPIPTAERARLFVDRVFTISGAGTVATGTLGAGCVRTGEDVELYPRRDPARIRSLQTHKRVEDRACAIARVAVNIAGTTTQDLERGDVLGAPGAWRPTTVFEGVLRPVRSLSHAITARGAFKVYSGAAEADARLRIYGDRRLVNGEHAFVRVTSSRPLVLDVFDRFVLRETGRQETVGGGMVLDPRPPRRAGPAPEARLARRAAAGRDDLPAILADEVGAVRTDDAYVITGSSAGTPAAGAWLLRDGVLADAASAVREHLAAFHASHPLDEGVPLASARAALVASLRPAIRSPDADLVDAVLGRLADDGMIERTSAAVRLPSHRPAAEADPRTRQVLDAVSGDREARPPTIADLVAEGMRRDAIDAAVRAGLVIRIAPDLVVAPSLVERAERVVSGAGADGITVSAFREALGTSRKYALPMLEWFDQRGTTRRVGDVRFARSATTSG